jgi:methionyl-tRNA formyltransferase
MRLVVFGSGSPLFAKVADALGQEHRVLAVVAPLARGPLWRRLLHRFRGVPGRVARRHRARLLDWTRGLEARVRALRPDLLVIASFPHLLPEALLQASGLGALNVHTSLLPRHRGPDPIFWTYWNDDPQAGVSVHWAAARFDTGDVVAQEAVDLARGRASTDLYLELASIGAALSCRALRALATGTAPRVVQDERAATYESAAEIARAAVPYEDWPAERVWHVLSGLGDRRPSLVTGPDGRRLKHGRATAFETGVAAVPGQIQVSPGSYRLHCRDGWVDLARGPEPAS